MIDSFLNHVYANVPLQQKKVGEFFSRVPQARKELGTFLSMYRPTWESPEIGGLEGLAKAYSRMIGEMMMCRMDFMRTGVYSTASQGDAFERVYNNAEQMLPYMLGLAVSQYLWPSHYAIFEFLKACIAKQNPHGHFMEVGSGHGIFLSYLASQIAADATIDSVDISAVSLSLSKALLAATNPEVLGRTRFIESDVALHKTAKPYDFIMMGEVLEHVEAPGAILRALRGLLADNGSLFVTTCVNCPAIDHVYLFHNVEEIRVVIRDAGFIIADEAVVPSEESKSMEYHEKYKLDILYGALLKKAA